MRKYLILFVLLVVPLLVQAQPADIAGVINDYARVLGIDTCENELFVSTNRGFSVGDRVLIIQMKGAAVDESNTTDFGKIVTYGTCGDNEIGEIQKIKGLFFTLKNRLVNRYKINDLVQIVRIPQYRSVRIASPVVAKPWDGSVGGVLIFEASDSVILSSDIDGSGTGFRGGDSSENNAEPDLFDYYYNRYDGEGGLKGEGIAHYITGKEAGRGPLANGGGGGNGQNSGGGGGSHIGIGGIGGDQVDEFVRKPLGGLGGRSLTDAPLSLKLFMGGGGGGGHENDSRGSSGGAGGGIVIIRAKDIIASGGSIRSNGASARMAGVDGAGGGGAGGTVVLDVARISGSPKIEAAGGDGGDNDANGLADYCYAPGGGGGGGLIWLPSSFTTLPMNLKGGDAGIVLLDTLPCFATTYGADSGTSGSIRTNPILQEGTIPFTRPGIQTHSFTLCLGDSVRLDAFGGTSITWSPSNGLDSTTVTSPIASPVTTQKYYASIYFMGCTYLDSVTVVVYPRPAPRIAGLNDVCGNSINGYKVFPNQSGNSYQWVVNNGVILDGQGTDSVTIRWNNAGNGSLVIRMTPDSSGCSGQDSISVVITPTRPPIVLGATDFCYGDSLILTAEQGFTGYKWNTGDTSSMLIVRSPGSYWVDVTGGKCILRSDTIAVQEYPKPKPTITTTIDTMVNPCDIAILDAGNYQKYYWSNGDSTAKIYVRDSGMYWVEVTDANGCRGRDTITIYTRLPAPTKFIIKLDTLSGNTGDRIYFPIRIISVDNPLLNCPGDYTLSVHFNRSLLVPIPPFIDNELTDRTRYITVTKTLTIGGAGKVNELPGLEFDVTLGDTSATPIVIDSFTWGEFPIEYIAYDGLFKLADICYDGGERLARTGGLVYLSTPKPNPAAVTTKLDFGTIEVGKHTLYLTDAAGNVVKTIASGEFKAGDHSVTVDTKLMASGLYFVVFRTPTITLHQGLYIER